MSILTGVTAHFILAGSRIVFPCVFQFNNPLFFVEDLISRMNSKQKKLRLFALNYLGFFHLEYRNHLVDRQLLRFWDGFCNSVQYLILSILMMLFHWSKRDFLCEQLIFFITLWIAFEKFHLEWDFSWPWLNLGMFFPKTFNGYNGMNLPVLLGVVCGF